MLRCSMLHLLHRGFLLTIPACLGRPVRTHSQSGVDVLLRRTLPPQSILPLSRPVLSFLLDCGGRAKRRRRFRLAMTSWAGFDSTRYRVLALGSTRPLCLNPLYSVSWQDSHPPLGLGYPYYNPSEPCSSCTTQPGLWRIIIYCSQPTKGYILAKLPLSYPCNQCNPWFPSSLVAALARCAFLVGPNFGLKCDFLQTSTQPMRSHECGALCPKRDAPDTARSWRGSDPSSISSRNRATRSGLLRV